MIVKLREYSFPALLATSITLTWDNICCSKMDVWPLLQCTKVNEIKDLHLLLLDKSSAFRKHENKKSVQVQRGTALPSYIF